MYCSALVEHLNDHIAKYGDCEVEMMFLVDYGNDDIEERFEPIANVGVCKFTIPDIDDEPEHEETTCILCSEEVECPT